MSPLPSSSPRQRAIVFAFALALAASAGIAAGADTDKMPNDANEINSTSASSSGAPLPGDSAYHLDVPLVDQDGKGLHFADGRGRPRLVSMFYTSCQYVCPLIVDTLKKTEAELTPTQRAGLDVLLVSLDPDTDTPTELRRVADQRHLDTPRWRLARTDKSHVRQLAAVLGIQYKQIEARDFSHSSALVLLDAEGRIVARSERMGQVDADFVAQARALLPAR
jgi:protein SCO1/2